MVPERVTRSVGRRVLQEVSARRPSRLSSPFCQSWRQCGRPPDPDRRVGAGVGRRAARHASHAPGPPAPRGHTAARTTGTHRVGRPSQQVQESAARSSSTEAGAAQPRLLPWSADPETSPRRRARPTRSSSAATGPPPPWRGGSSVVRAKRQTSIRYVRAGSRRRTGTRRPDAEPRARWQERADQRCCAQPDVARWCRQVTTLRRRPALTM